MCLLSCGVLIGWLFRALFIVNMAPGFMQWMKGFITIFANESDNIIMKKTLKAEITSAKHL